MTTEKILGQPRMMSPDHEREREGNLLGRKSTGGYNTFIGSIKSPRASSIKYYGC